MSALVVETGSANLASVLASLSRLGASPRLTRDATEIAEAERLVLPGVGAFGPAMSALRERGLVDALRARILSDKPTLGICLGMQLLFASSEESPGARGLGLIDGAVSRLTRAPRVPELGWNRVSVDGEGALTSGDAYFAHSYARISAPSGWRAATTTHGERFVSAIERGRVLACQFHPELSGAYGAGLLERWLSGERARSTAQPELALAAPRVIPCLDVKDGRVVKGVRFQGLRDAGDPVELARAYEAQGADELVFLDVSATPEGRGAARATIAKVRAVLSIPLTVGGGVRSADDAGRLLDAGADKVGVNTAAVERPELIDEIAERFGRQCAVLALDAALVSDGRWETVTHSGKTRTGKDALAWAREAAARGAGEILLTSWDRDGTKSGYDLALLRAITRAVSVPVIASGGAAHAEHLAEALEAGADAVLAASIFHEGAMSVRDVKDALRARGVEVRTC